MRTMIDEVRAGSPRDADSPAAPGGAGVILRRAIDEGQAETSHAPDPMLPTLALAAVIVLATLGIGTVIVTALGRRSGAAPGGEREP